MNWGLMKDNQRFGISIPIGKMSVKETRTLLIKMFPDLNLVLQRRLKLDKIRKKINEK
jgi:hypothetical protein